MTAQDYVIIIGAIFSGLATLLGIWATTQVKAVKASAEAVDAAALRAESAANTSQRAAELSGTYAAKARANAKKASQPTDAPASTRKPHPPGAGV